MVPRAPGASAAPKIAPGGASVVVQEVALSGNKSVGTATLAQPGDWTQLGIEDRARGTLVGDIGLRIDLILASTALAARCTACTIDREPRRAERPSDHTPVIGSFDI